MPKPQLELDSIYKSFGDTEIIQNISFSVHRGEFIVFVGPSGCGKSTLLRLIAGLEDISSGEIIIDGEVVNDLPPVKRDVAMVFQSYALYPHMNVYENMAFGLRNLKVKEDEISRRVRQASKILQIDHLHHFKPKDLSGGQRQRVAIGRTIVREPRLFLFDEPLSNLDAALRVQMRIEMTKLHQRLKNTMIYVTHDQVEAMTLADRIVVLNKGKIEQIGAPLELYEKPQNIFVAGFIGSPMMNFIKCEVNTVSTKGTTLLLPGKNKVTFTHTALRGLKKGTPLTLGVRPEHVSLRKEYKNSVCISGKMVALEDLGNITYAYAQLEDDTLMTCQVKKLKGTKKSMDMSFLPADCYIFDEREQAIL